MVTGAKSPPELDLRDERDRLEIEVQKLRAVLANERAKLERPPNRRPILRIGFTAGLLLGLVAAPAIAVALSAVWFLGHWVG